MFSSRASLVLAVLLLTTRLSAARSLRETTCSDFSEGCASCIGAGCVFQDGACKPDCEYGPLGMVLGTCYVESASCPTDEQAEEDAGEEPDKPISFCTLQLEPVCFEDGSMAGSNSCFASLNPSADGREYRKEWCAKPRNVEGVLNSKHTQAVDLCESHHDNCGACLEAGCSYHGGGLCHESCIIADGSCWSGAAEQCPKPLDVCSGASTCSECTDAGCVFQDGDCKPECEFGPLGDFIAVCFSDAWPCPA